MDALLDGLMGFHSEIKDQIFLENFEKIKKFANNESKEELYLSFYCMASDKVDLALISKKEKNILLMFRNTPTQLVCNQVYIDCSQELLTLGLNS